jgi:preprotein translocase subunit Sec61beta
MADNMMMPSSGGGLLRYNDEYPSKLRISPEQVIFMVIAVVVLMVIVKIAL